MNGPDGCQGANLGVPEVVQVVQTSASTNDIGHGIAFWSWSYVTAAVKLEPGHNAVDVVPDTGCGVTIADKTWLRGELPEVAVSTMASPLKVRGVGAKRCKKS